MWNIKEVEPGFTEISRDGSVLLRLPTSEVADLGQDIRDYFAAKNNAGIA